MPFTVVTSPALKALLEEISGRLLQMPTIPKTIQTLSKRFDLMKFNMRNELKEQEHVCLTADVWSHRTRSYLGVSVHYYDSAWNRKSYILAFKHLTQRHTFDYLARRLCEIMNDYGLTVAQVRHIITDGGSNFCKAFREFGANDDFRESFVEMVENQEDNSDNEDEEDDIVVVDGNTLLLVDENVDGSASPSSQQLLAEDDIIHEIDKVPIHFDQISFPDSINDEIILPPQMRCFSHLLNLIGKYILQRFIFNSTSSCLI